MDDLESLIARLQKLIDAATGKLEDNLSPAQIREYHTIMEELLTRYHLAAYMVGADTATLSDKARAKVREGVANQLAFLQGFITEIEGEEEFKAGWENRARQYATSVKVPYWEGKVKLLPLPAMPGEIGSTQCGQACGCEWDVKTIDAEKGDYNAYWRYGDTVNHCQTCKERARTWNPLKIRNGVLLSD